MLRPVLFLAMISSLHAVEIVAHRGASHDFPENTLASAQGAWDQKADAVECDIYLTKDGKIVVMHDQDTKRTAGAEGLIADQTLAELKTLDAGLWKNPQFKDTRIPTLDELLATGPQNRKFLIEIKGSDAAILPELKATLQRSGLQPAQLVIISFDLNVLEAAARELPAYSRLWILSYNDQSPSLEDAIARATKAGVTGLDLNWKWPIDSAFVKQVKAAGLQLHTWTVDDLSVATRLREAGIDSITTNRPGYLREGLSLSREKTAVK